MKRITFYWFVITTALFMLLGCTKVEKSGRYAIGDGADLVLTDARVYTANTKEPWAEAVAVKGNKIVFVGSGAEIKRYIGSNTEVKDLNGKMLLPGFIDTHAHPVMAAGMSKGLELNPEDSESALLEQLAEFVRENPDYQGYLGFGFHSDVFNSGKPHKSVLDKVVPDKPVILIDSGGHAAWVNSKALELTGITKDTPDPIPGSHFYERDKGGNPTGYCLEGQTFFPMIKKLGLMSVGAIVDGSEDLFWLMSGAGITTVFDAGMMGFEETGYQALQTLEKTGELPFRVVGSYMVLHPSQAGAVIDELKNIKANFSSNLIRPKAIKIQNDGTKEARTAAMFQDYTDDPGNKGSTLLDSDTLNALVRNISREGLDIHIHAIGNKAVNDGLNAFELARKDAPDTGSRFSMAHLESVLDDDLGRFGELDVVAQTTPFWFYYGEGEHARGALGRSRAEKLYRFKAINDAGGKLSFGSDFPASEGIGGLFPLYNMEMGMTRQLPGDPDSPITQPESARLSLETMIQGYTINAAYQLNMEREIGSIEVGKKADLVILQKDLFAIDVYDIHRVRVDSVYMDGKKVYGRNWQSWIMEFALGI